MKPVHYWILIASSVLTLNSPAIAADEVVLDYRDDAFRSGQAFYPAPVRQRIASALTKAPDGVGKALRPDFAILGDADVSTGAGRETIYLLAKQAPVAAQPFPDASGQFLLVLQDDKTTGIYKLPKDSNYARLVGVVAKGKGVREVLLEGSFFNMGQTVTSIDLVEVHSGAAAAVKQVLNEVYYDGCDNPVGQRERRAATVVHNTDGTLQALPHKLSCD